MSCMHARSARRADCALRSAMGQDGMSSPDRRRHRRLPPTGRAFARPGPRCSATCCSAPTSASARSAHDFGFSVAGRVASTLLVWAGPAQVILISTLGAGASLIEVAIAVGLSGVRLLPMVVAMLPMIKRPDTRAWKLMLPAHFTAVSMWVEAMRLLPKLPRENRIAFCNGLGTGYVDHRDDRDRHRLLSRRQAAAADERGAAVPHAARVPDVDLAQRPHAGRPARARLRPRCSARCSPTGRSGST